MNSSKQQKLTTEEIEVEVDRQIQMAETYGTYGNLDTNFNLRLSATLLADVQEHCRNKRTATGEVLTPSKWLRSLIIRELYSDR